MLLIIANRAPAGCHSKEGFGITDFISSLFGLNSSSGFAPAPTNTSYYLRGDGTWAVTDMAGAVAATSTTPGAPGVSGFVPPPQAADVSNFLRGDGTWSSVATNQPYFYATSATPVSPTTAGAAFLIPFVGPGNTFGKSILTNAPLTLFALSPIGGVVTTYRVMFGFTMIQGSSTGPYTPPTFSIINKQTNAALSAVGTVVPIPISYGKYYSAGTVITAYVSTLPAESITIAVALNAATTDVMTNPWLSIEPA
jgi:hypothetical protein